MSRWYLIVGESIFISVLCIVAYCMFRQTNPIPNATRTDIKLADARQQVYLRRDPQGKLTYLIRHPDGIVEPISSDQLAEQLYHAGNAGWFSLLGSSSATVLFWLGVGLFGQLLFTGRMVVQWLASERKGTSVVPPMFWWMSLVGSLLLLAYFLWRRDPIGLLGQAFGSFVYLRNILWILEGKKVPARVESKSVEAVN
jgi:lipid-A-disaccharide synthase-like uncharacterized protein